MNLYNNFTDFKKANPNWEKEFEIIQRDSAKFKRVVCRWKEGEKKLEHIFLATINIETGEVYLDCRRRKILAKHLTLIAARPLFSIIRLLWHLTIIGPLAVEARELSKEIKEAKEEGTLDKNQLRKRVFKSLSVSFLRNVADIVRTPVYGTAMTVVSVAAIPLAAFNPNSLYTTRAIVGRLERRLLRVNDILARYNSSNLSHKSLSPCFSPIEEMFPVDKPNPRTKKELKEMFKRLARSNIRFRRMARHPCNDCCALLKEDQAYLSAAAKKKSLSKIK